MSDDFADTPEAVAGTSAEGCEWSSLHDIIQNCTLFNAVDPSDIQQGQLGDCWLVSAMASIAEYPDCVQSMIEENGDMYTVNLYSYEDQTFIPIEVNDRVPTQGGQPMFVHATADGEIWPCLIEKAFAKISGEGYKTLSGGLQCFAFGMMKGCEELYHYQRLDKSSNSFDCLKFDYSSNNSKDQDGQGLSMGDAVTTDEMFEELIDCNQKQYLMCASSNAGSDTQQSGQGVTQGHGYTILDVQDGPGGSDFKLIQMRNPWGHGEWTGAWSDGSAEWDDNPDVANALNPQEKEDGTFWMPWDGFLDQYSAIDVCKGAGASRHTPSGKPPQPDLNDCCTVM